MCVDLAYGRTGLTVELPDQTDIVTSRFVPGLPDEAAAPQLSPQEMEQQRDIQQSEAPRQQGLTVPKTTDPAASGRKPAPPIPATRPWSSAHPRRSARPDTWPHKRRCHTAPAPTRGWP